MTALSSSTATVSDVEPAETGPAETDLAETDLAGPPAAPSPLSINAKPEPAAFRRPIDLIVHDHYNQRIVCERLEALVDRLETGEPTSGIAAEVLTYITGALAAHTRDEEDSLFPLLRQRCLPEDRLDAIIGQLSCEHQLDDDLVAFLTDDLTVMAAGRRLSNPRHFAINATVYARTQLRHLAWENRVVVPLARRRLTEADQQQFGREMAGRRGITGD